MTIGRRRRGGPGLGGLSLHRNLVGYFKLEELSGTRFDATGRGNNLTDNNTVTQAAGIVGNAGQFTAANSEYLSIADNADLSVGDIDFTVACWLYFDTNSGTRVALSKGNNDTDNNTAYMIQYVAAPTDRLRFRVGNGTNNTTVVADTFGAILTATWLFVVAWHDSVADTINIQINNGGANSAARTGGSYDDARAFRIGTDPGDIPGDFWDGRIDAVGVWKRVLTAAERTLLYNNGNGRQLF